MDPSFINTIEEFSPLFISLIYFLKEGKYLDNQAIRQACTLLETLTHRTHRLFTGVKLLCALVPKQDHSYAGFTESLVLLLTYPDETLFQATLSFLHTVICSNTVSTHFKFQSTGFFALLPKAFYTRDLHLSTQSELMLMHIVSVFLYISHPNLIKAICQEEIVSIDTVRRTFIDNFLHPVKPFLEFVCRNRRRIENSQRAWFFSDLLANLYRYSLELEQMTQSALPLSLPLTCTDCLAFFESHNRNIDLLRGVMVGRDPNLRKNLDYQRRRKQIVEKLCQEGLLDEAELHFDKTGFECYEGRDVYFGRLLIHTLGGNLSY